jgi:hypothetical protein
MAWWSSTLGTSRVLKNGSGLRLASRRAARSLRFTHPTAGEDAGRYGRVPHRFRAFCIIGVA